MSSDTTDNHDHIREYIDLCWEHYKLYKEAQEKLLYWIASVFTLVISATGIFGAVNPEKQSDFQLRHIILFHVIFLIVWLFYLYKKINADMYSQIGKEGEMYLKRCCTNTLPDPLPRFFELKSRYLGESNELTAGRSFSNYSGALIIVTYVALSLMPIWKDTGLVDGGFKIAWEPAIAFFVFIAAVFGAMRLYRKEKKSVQDRIKAEWAILPCDIKCLPPS